MVWLWLLTLARRRNSPRSSSLLFPRSDTVGLFLLSPLNIPTVRGPPRPSKRTVLQPADPTCCMLQEARSEVLFCGGPWRGGRQREKHGIPSARIGRATLSRGTLFPLPRGDHGQHQSARRSQRRCGAYFRARGSKQAPQDNGKTCSGLRSSGRRCGATRYGAEALWMLVPIWGPRCMLQLKAVVKR